MADPTMTFDEVAAAVIEADLGGGEASDELLDALLYYLDDYHLRPQLNAALHRHSKFPAIKEGLRAACVRREENLVDSTPVSFAEYVDSPELAQTFVDGLVRNAKWALDHKCFMDSYRSLSSMCELALAGGAHTCMLLDRVLAELATYEPFVKHPVGAELRLFFRRVRFMALAGYPRPLELVLPGDDILWVGCVKDAIGYQMEQLYLSTDERAKLVEAWGALDWDDTLDVNGVFESEIERPSIEERPWDELAALVLKTSFHRFERGQRESETVTRVFARPVSLDARIALADSLIAFATSHRALGRDTKQMVLDAIKPHLDGRKLPKALAKALALKPAAKKGKTSELVVD